MRISIALPATSAAAPVPRALSTSQATTSTEATPLPADADTGQKMPPDAANPAWWHPELHKRLLAAARRMCHTNPADAADLVQEGYLRLVARGADDIESVPAWLLTTQRHLLIDRIRHERLSSRWHGSTPLADLLDGYGGNQENTNESPEQALERQQNCEQALWHLVLHLEPDEIAILLLREVFGWDFAELAQLLGKSPAATRQMMVRLRDRLRTRSLSDPRAPLEYNSAQQALVRTCLTALINRDTRELEARVRQAPIHAARAAATIHVRTLVNTPTVSNTMATPECHVAQIAGGYALALMFGNVLLCTLPLGPLALSETAQEPATPCT